MCLCCIIPPAPKEEEIFLLSGAAICAKETYRIILLQNLIWTGQVVQQVLQGEGMCAECVKKYIGSPQENQTNICIHIYHIYHIYIPKNILKKNFFASPYSDALHLFLSLDDHLTFF